MDDHDRLELHELPGRYGDIIDDRNWDSLANVFTEDATFEVDGKVLSTLAQIQNFMSAGTNHPLTHLMTNIYIDETAEGTILHSRIVAMQNDGTIFSGRYRDLVVNEGQGWRFKHRVYVTTAGRT
jgi:hypothetical protein